ncbi:MAG: hypothetical protein M1830_006176, partial [Pleopsidium flavum]
MRKNHGMEDSGGAYMIRMDIQNAGQVWKQLNPDERAGFMSTMGSKGVEDLMKEYKTLGGLKVDDS